MSRRGPKSANSGASASRPLSKASKRRAWVGVGVDAYPSETRGVCVEESKKEEEDREIEMGSSDEEEEEEKEVKGPDLT